MGGAVVKQVVQVSWMDKGIKSIGATIDPSKSVILNFSYYLFNTGNATSNHAWAARILNSTQVEILNAGTVGANGYFTVVEFTSGVKVQHLTSANMNAATNTYTTIPQPVNVAKTTVVPTGNTDAYTSTTTLWNAKVRCRLVDTDEVQFNRNTGYSADAFGYASVLEFL